MNQRSLAALLVSKEYKHFRLAIWLLWLLSSLNKVPKTYALLLLWLLLSSSARSWCFLLFLSSLLHLLLLLQLSSIHFKSYLKFNIFEDLTYLNCQLCCLQLCLICWCTLSRHRLTIERASRYSILLCVISLLDLWRFPRRAVLSFTTCLYSICHQDRYKLRILLFCHLHSYLRTICRLAICRFLDRAFYYLSNSLHRLGHRPKSTFRNLLFCYLPSFRRTSCHLPIGRNHNHAFCHFYIYPCTLHHLPRSLRLLLLKHHLPTDLCICFRWHEYTLQNRWLGLAETHQHICLLQHAKKYLDQMLCFQATTLHTPLRRSTSRCRSPSWVLVGLLCQHTSVLCTLNRWETGSSLQKSKRDYDLTLRGGLRKSAQMRLTKLFQLFSLSLCLLNSTKHPPCSCSFASEASECLSCSSCFETSLLN